MNKKQRKIQTLKEWFLNSLAKGPLDDTNFDRIVLDAITELQNRFADDPAEGYIITNEMQKLGFVLKSENPGLCSCSTIPCFGGKMPYQNLPVVGCAIGRTMCDQSPIESMRESKAFEEQIKKDNS